MKNRLQGMVIGLLVGVLLTFTAVQATGTSKAIEVYFRDLIFTFDGVEEKPENPGFIYEGTTYVPLRFVAEAIGAPVRYYHEKGKIAIGYEYAEAPGMIIDEKKSYEAVVETNKGSFTIELFAKDAPKTVNNFVFLSKDGYYNDVLFHRIIASFMVQTGDPTGTGSGGPGYVFKDELNNGHRYAEGVVAMANAGPNTNGSQFFVCSGPDCEGLNAKPDYTIFGKVIKGMDTIQAIAATPVKETYYGERSLPSEDVKMIRVDIVEKE